jgi:hypothetical protein
MADITSSTIIGHEGVDVTNSTNLDSASGSGDVFDNGGNTILVVKNGSGGSITVTISATDNQWDEDNVDEGGSVANGETGIFGPLDPKRFNNASGQVDVSYSGTSSVEVKAFPLGDPLTGQ